MYERCGKYVEQDQSSLIVTAGHFSKGEGLKLQDGSVWRYVMRSSALVCVPVKSLFIPARAVLRCMDKKSLNQRVKYGVSNAQSLSGTHSS